MSSISDVVANNSGAVLENTNAKGTSQTGKSSGNYGKTIGKAQLSEEGAKYYEELKKKFSGMDFVLVSSDMKEYAKANASSYGNANRMVVLIDEEKIERMATDEKYRAQYEGLITKAQSQMPQLQSVMKNNSDVKTIGMQVNDNGTASFFAVMNKSSQEISEKIAAKRKAKKEAEKAAEKKEAKQERLDKINEKRAENAKETSQSDTGDDDYVILQADTVEELMRKIEEHSFSLRADAVRTPFEMQIGQSIDFKG